MLLDTQKKKNIIENMNRGRPVKLDIKEKVNTLAQNGFNFQEISDMLGLKSRQVARYHFRSYPHLWKKVIDNDKKKK